MQIVFFKKISSHFILRILQVYIKQKGLKQDFIHRGRQ